jgi:hypothetical protein
MRPWESANAASMTFLSRSASVATRGPVKTDRRSDARFSQLSLTENVSLSHRITARSMTFWSSRMFTGQSTTYQGGAHGAGMVFELAPKASAGWTEKILHSFGNGADGVGSLRWPDLRRCSQSVTARSARAGIHLLWDSVRVDAPRGRRLNGETALRL